MGSRRSAGDGSIYRRTDGLWAGSVTLGYRADGTRRRKTVTSKSKATVQRKLRDLLRDQHAHGDLPTASLTVERWMTEWLDTIAARRVRERTLAGYRGYVNNWIVPHLGRRRLDRLTPAHIRGLYRAMSDAGKSEATQRQCHAILHRALLVAVREGHILANPAAKDKIDPPGTHVNTRTPLELAEARRVIACLDGDPLASRWLVALLEGLRQGEALGLKWEDVDLPGRRLFVTRAVQRVTGKGLVEVPPKSRTSNRAVPLLDPVAFALTRHRDRVGGTGYVWGGDKPTDPRRDYQQWRDLLDRAGVDPRPLHAARATTASLLNEAGVPTEVVAEILGHSQVQITQRHYIRGNETSHRAAMDRLGGLLAGDDQPRMLGQ